MKTQKFDSLAMCVCVCVVQCVCHDPDCQFLLLSADPKNITHTSE